MKNLIFLLTFLMFSLCGISQTTKTFVKNFTVVPTNLNVDIQCEKNYLRWEGNTIKIEMTISASVPSETMNSFVKYGRYDLEYKNENDTLIISLPKMKNEIVLGGQRVTEKISMVIWLPETTIISDETIFQ
jgi:hypothetical protein